MRGTLNHTVLKDGCFGYHKIISYTLTHLSGFRKQGSSSPL